MPGRLPAGPCDTLCVRPGVTWCRASAACPNENPASRGAASFRHGGRSPLAQRLAGDWLRYKRQFSLNSQTRNPAAPGIECSSNEAYHPRLAMPKNMKGASEYVRDHYDSAECKYNGPKGDEYLRHEGYSRKMLDGIDAWLDEHIYVKAYHVGHDKPDKAKNHFGHQGNTPLPGAEAKPLIDGI